MTDFLDSGKRETYEGGAVRDDAGDKPRYDLISPYFQEIIWDGGGTFQTWFANNIQTCVLAHADTLLEALEATRRSPTSRECWGLFLALVTRWAYPGCSAYNPERLVEKQLQAALLAGAKKYDERNWEKGIPTSRSFASLGRHIRKLLNADHDENHYWGILCNIMFIWHNQRMVEEKRMDPKWADWEGYPKKTTPQSLYKDQQELLTRYLLKYHRDTIELAPKTAPDHSIISGLFIKREFPLHPILTHFKRQLTEEGCRPLVISHILGGVTIPLIINPEPGDQVRCVYIAGPMRGYQWLNFPAFNRARDFFVNKGWVVVSPADIDRAAGINGDDPDEGSQREPVYRDFHALHMLDGERGDAIAMLPKWKQSTGAPAEFHIAKWMGLGILNAITGEQLK